MHGEESRDHRILLVDDSAPDLKLLVQSLQGENFKLTVAMDGAKAIARATASPQPDVIVMDVSMPYMDGFAVCHILKHDRRTAHIPIIFVTACGTLDYRLRGFSTGAADYVRKPYEPEEILWRIRVHLRDRGEGRLTPSQAVGAACERSEAVSFLPGAATGHLPTITPDQAIVDASTQYLADHLYDPPSRKRLAQLIGVNERRLTQAFRTRLGKTVHDYVQDQRMSRARALLNGSSLTVADIADQLGFSSPANFSSAFRRHLGCSPAAYRQHSSSAH